MPSSFENDHFVGSTFITNTNSGKVSVNVTFLIASLLVYAAKGDGSISQPETDKMIDTLCTRLGMRNAEAMGHLSAAVMHMADEGNFALKLEKIAADLTQNEKESVFSMLIEVVTIDGVLDPGEHQVVVHAGQILGLSQDNVRSELRSITNVPD